ncbi:MauE/DoxX family redox-associated membrane protein [Amycolatopsis plumensis]|uniref:MauE/DoxX family redox-associated membrane protein n=1 Tax=Amycolatopsis plumensis TaxID=236508 RepID=A0ABV5TWZ2_9PSEU
MLTFWSAALTAFGAVLLTAAGAAHAARHREHRAVLRAHRLLPPVVAAVAAAAEVAVGAATLATLLTAPAATALPATAQAALYCAFAGYTAVLRTRRPGVPCGCFGAEKVSWAVVCRAVVLAAGSAGSAVLGAPGPGPDRWACVAAGVVLAMANHLIPAWRAAGGRKPGRAFR